MEDYSETPEGLYELRKIHFGKETEMSTHSQIMQVYRQDQRRPFYSLNGGRDRSARKLNDFARGQSYHGRRWTWGHFPAALEKALRVA